ncbi:MAG: aldo/keto reductase, partial [Nocardioidaceae bacterium]
MTAPPPSLPLNDGRTLPAIGYGTAPLDDDEAPDTVAFAIESGYRLLDTAARYDNETGVGRGVRESSVDRSELVVTTKLRGDDHGRDAARRGLDGSLTRLGLDYVDLYLIHWPLPRVDKYVESWQTMIDLRDEGLVRSIGVSNFTAEHIDRLERETGVLPTVNQIEMHLEWTQQEQRAYDAGRAIVTQAWSPLRRGGSVLEAATITDIAEAHGVTPGQVALRWHVQSGAVPIPFSSNRERIANNRNVFSFELSDDEMRQLATLDSADRFGGDPMTH